MINKAEHLNVVRSKIDFDRAKTFQQVLEEHMLKAAKEHPEIYTDTQTRKPLTEEGIRQRSVIMTQKLAEGAAGKDGKGVQAAIKQLQIKNTYTAISAYLNGAPSHIWKR